MRASHLLAPAIVAAAGPRQSPPAGCDGSPGWLRASTLGRCSPSGARSLSGAEAPEDAALVPVVLFIMHAAHGLGQMYGWANYGLPWRALAEVAHLNKLVGAVPASEEPAYAPSLHGDGPGPSSRLTASRAKLAAGLRDFFTFASRHLRGISFP